MNRNAACGWASMLVLGLVLGLTGLAAPACAKQVGIPENQPKVLLDVPDNWTVTFRDSTAEMHDPEKTSLIVVGLVKRDRGDINKWQKAATQKMLDFGITIDPKAGHAAPATTMSSGTTPSSNAAAAAPNLSTISPGSAATVFSGAPSLAAPETAPTATTALEDKQAAGPTLDQLTGAAASAKPKIPFKAIVLYGALLNGKPVDAEFLTYALAEDTVFLLQQESGSTDSRAVAVMNSVRPAK